MTKTKTIWTSLVALLLVSALLIPGCQQAPTSQKVPPDPFNTTWDLGEEGRSFSISGNSAGHMPGKQSEFLLKINNHSGAERWQGEYCILLVDTNGVVKEVTHEQFDIPVGLETTGVTVVHMVEAIGAVTPDQTDVSIHRNVSLSYDGSQSGQMYPRCLNRISSPIG